MKILLVRLSAIGDVINTLPALSALKMHFPSARFSWLVEDSAAAILGNHPFLEHVFVFRRKQWLSGFPGASFTNAREFFALLRSIRRQRFTFALDFQGNLKGAVLSFLSGARWTIGYARKDCKEGNFLFSDKRVFVPPEIQHRIEKHLYLLTALGVEMPPPPPVIQTSEEEDILLAPILNGKEGKLVVMHPGASLPGHYKRWDIAKFADLATRLLDERKVRIVVTCGPGESHLGQEIRRKSDVEVFSPPTIKVLARLLKSADLFIGADSGPLYIAAAMQTPVLALFGPTDPRVYGPYFGKREIIWKRRDCCPCKDKKCTSMSLIEVDEVFEKASRLLE